MRRAKQNIKILAYHSLTVKPVLRKRQILSELLDSTVAVTQSYLSERDDESNMVHPCEIKRQHSARDETASIFHNAVAACAESSITTEESERETMAQLYSRAQQKYTAN